VRQQPRQSLPRADVLARGAQQAETGRFGDALQPRERGDPRRIPAGRGRDDQFAIGEGVGLPVGLGDRAPFPGPFPIQPNGVVPLAGQHDVHDLARAHVERAPAAAGVERVQARLGALHLQAQPAVRGRDVAQHLAGSNPSSSSDSTASRILRISNWGP